MIVILDTNVWVSTLALTSGVGSAVRYFLREQNARLGLPEVIRLETEVHLRAELHNYCAAIQKNHRQLLALFGELKEVVLPTPDEVESLIGKVFSNLGVQIEEIPFTLKSARASLIRAIRKIPPSDKNQQFKDGVLWEDCLMMLQAGPVCLVSNDSAFYEGRDKKQGLAAALLKDLQAQPNTLTIFPELDDLLASIQTPVQVPSDLLLRAYMDLRGNEIRAMAASRSFNLEGDPDVQANAFVTENSAVLYVSFLIEFPCGESADGGNSCGRLAVRGEGTYNATTQEFPEITIHEERLHFRLQDGAEKTQSTYFVHAASALGHSTVAHSVRYKP